ncbi:hypothetical protein K7I13_01090 [Brucepastera parasyntrophica]|uniref:hypothetical protein n=1 Tax=Brucepastera parasyntrophica TaxID=2880008 RepID=UPI002109B733|nr:hypothetical protein [Brucepastera parasyntrophica]ULQ59968.1 hypothetical protein K7I13_01090 [Brucepastera parasyntrophica]
MKRIVFALLFIMFLIFQACVTDSASVVTDNEAAAPTDSEIIFGPEGQAVNVPSDASDDAVIARFDNFTITKLTFTTTKTEIEEVVENLNKITLARDYNRWLTYLSDEYIQTFSNPANLETVSASLPTKGIKLKNLQDYFRYVFVPSRQDVRVDDIQFVSPTRVYVIMEISRDVFAAVYILEKTNSGWKLVPKNQ